MTYILITLDSNSSISTASNQLNIACFFISGAGSLKKSFDFIEKILINHFFMLDKKPHASDMDAIEATAYFSDLAVEKGISISTRQHASKTIQHSCLKPHGHSIHFQL